MQKPRGPKDQSCPLWRKSMEKVCHACPWWVQVRGKDPQRDIEIDEWNCAIAWGPTLAINTAQQARQGAAATESFRNVMVRMNSVSNNALTNAIAAVAGQPTNPRLLLEMTEVPDDLG